MVNAAKKNKTCQNLICSIQPHKKTDYNQNPYVSQHGTNENVKTYPTTAKIKSVWLLEYREIKDDFFQSSNYDVWM